jgi:hypothetical protein
MYTKYQNVLKGKLQLILFLEKNWQPVSNFALCIQTCCNPPWQPMHTKNALLWQACMCWAHTRNPPHSSKPTHSQSSLELAHFELMSLPAPMALANLWSWAQCSRHLSLELRLKSCAPYRYRHSWPQSDPGHRPHWQPPRSWRVPLAWGGRAPRRLVSVVSGDIWMTVQGTW